jgi:hypothetical protein
VADLQSGYFADFKLLCDQLMEFGEKHGVSLELIIVESDGALRHAGNMSEQQLRAVGAHVAESTTREERPWPTSAGRS